MKSAYQGISGDHGDFTVDMSSKKPEQKGFVPIHKRWVVERTFAWLKRQRRLARDDEFDSSHQQSMIYIAMSNIMLNLKTGSKIVFSRLIHGIIN